MTRDLKANTIQANTGVFLEAGTSSIDCMNMEPHHIPYPSIYQYRHVIHTVVHRAKRHCVPPPTLEFTGTVKLHGGNAAVVTGPLKLTRTTAESTKPSTERVWAQSRHKILLPEANRDKRGFAQYVHDTSSVFCELLALARSVYEGAGRVVQEDDYLAMYGEWCGEKIQKGVALTGLPKMFVIFGIRVKHGRTIGSVDREDQEEEEDKAEDQEQGMKSESELEPERNYWFTPEQLLTVHNGFGSDRAAQHSIYSIHQFPTWTVAIDFSHPEATQNRICALTAAVEAECPVGRYFGVSGVGEGIVWSAAAIPTNNGSNDSIIVVPFQIDDLIFKVKGQKHSVSKVRTLAPICPEKIADIARLVEAIVTEHRLEMKLEEMQDRDLGDGWDMSGLGPFLKIVCQDVKREERDTIVASGLSMLEVMAAVAKHARHWFLTRIEC